MSAQSFNESGKQRALILVVERNPAVQRLERFFFEQAGYAVEFAKNGVAALARARELKPKIVVTEILVPGLDGLSLCRALKSDPSTCSTLVLIFSHLHAEERAREVQADAFLVKPLNEQLLIETVEKLNDLFEVHSISNQQVSNMSDNILLLRFTPETEMQRTIRIIKTRGSAHDNREHTMEITNKGVAVKRIGK